MSALSHRPSRWVRNKGTYCPNRGDIVIFDPAESAYITKIFEPVIPVPMPIAAHCVPDGVLTWKNMSPLPELAVLEGTFTLYDKPDTGEYCAVCAFDPEAAYTVH